MFSLLYNLTLVFRWLLYGTDSQIIDKTNMLENTEHYRAFKLENGINILLIHNKKFINSSIKISVEAGDIYNDDKALGLAHLCEHCIVNGSGDDWIKYDMLNNKQSLASTENEKVVFQLTLKDIFFLEGVKWLSNALISSNFTKHRIEKEIEIIEQEYWFRYYNFNRQCFDLFQYMLDDLIPESRFADGNKSTLNCPDIQDQVTKFILQHYTGNRVTIVIASSLSLDKQTELVHLFDKIPKGELKDGVSEDNTILTFNEKYKVPSLIRDVPKTDLIKPECKGALIKYYSNLFIPYLRIQFVLPSKTAKFELKLVEYFKEVLIGEMKDSLKANLTSKNYITNMNVLSLETRRLTTVMIILDLGNNINEEIINEILRMVYQWLISHKPSEDVYKYLAEKAQRNYKESIDSGIVVDEYMEAMVLYQCYNPEYVTLTYKYSEEDIKEFFRFLADPNNATYFLLVNDIKQCPIEHKYCHINHSDPVSKRHVLDNIKPNEQYQRIERRIPEFEDSDIPELVELSVSNFIKAPHGRIETIHKQMPAGEYTIFQSDLSFNDECNVSITFCLGNKKREILQCELYFMTLKSLISEILEEMTSEFSFYIQCFNQCRFTMIGKARDIMFLMTILHDKMQEFEVTDEILLKARSEMLRECEKLTYCTKLIDFPSESTTAFIKQSKFESKQIINSTDAKLPEKYFIKIQACGKITEECIEAIYDKIKCKAKNAEMIAWEYKEHEFTLNVYSHDKANKTKVVTVMYEFTTCSINLESNPLPEGRIEKERQDNKNLAQAYIVALFIENIFSIQMLKNYMIENPISYVQLSFFKYTNRKFYVAFSLISTYDSEYIKKLLLNQMITDLKNTIHLMSEEEFTEIKEMIRLSIKNHEYVNKQDHEIALYMDLLAIYLTDLQDVLLNEIDLINKDNLLRIMHFNEAPFIITSRNIN